MLTIKSDNRVLTQDAKFSYLTSNYTSAQVNIDVVNGLGFSADDYVLIGEWGSETSEICKVSSILDNTLSLSSATLFAHPESTKITIIQYNEVKFYQTATTTFSENENPLTVGAEDGVNGAFNIQADSFYTVYQDKVNTTGYGWFKFLNSTLLVVSTRSNYIPYGDFEDSSVKKVIDAFYSQLNNKEQKLISIQDAFYYLREGYSLLWNSLNLVNDSYSLADQYSLVTVAGQAEYAWPAFFSSIESITDSFGKPVPKIAVQRFQRNNQLREIDPTYYLRGRNIGISPVPTTSATFTVMYKQTVPQLTSYTDTVQTPDNNFWPLINFMLFKSMGKLNRVAEAPSYYQLFSDGIDMMKVTSHKQEGGNDSWGIEWTQLV